MAGFGSNKKRGEASEVVAQDAEIRALIASAEVLPSVERVAILQQALFDLDVSDLSADQRIEHLNTCARVTIDTLSELVNEFHTLTLPLSADHESRVRSVLSLSRHLDNHFARLKADRKSILPGPVLYLRLALLLEELTFSAACYHPWSDNLWVRVHSIYTRARDLGLADYAPKTNRQEPAPKTLTQLYLIAVLTAAADPYQMPYRDIQNARTLATVFLETVSVDYSTKMRTAGPGQHRLLIDDRVDKPVLPYRGGKELDHHHVVLNLEQCYQVLADRLELLQNDPKSKDPLFGSMQRQNIIGLYRHVLVKWGWQPTRTGTRVNMDAEFDLKLGYNNILEGLTPQVANDDPFPPLRRFSPTHTESDTARQAAPQREHTRPPAAVSIDVSETGIGLRVSEVNDAALRVGELIAFRPRNSNQPWRVGAIRWVKSVSNGAAEIGVLKLPGELRVGSLLGVERVRSVGQASAESVYDLNEDVPVLIAADVNEDAAPTSAHVLLHTNMGDRNLVHWISFDGIDRVALSMKKFLSTRYVVAYGCHLSEARKRPGPKRKTLKDNDFVFH